MNVENSIQLVIAKYSKFQEQINGQNEFELYKHFSDNVNKCIVQKWVEETFVQFNIKNIQISKDFREEGNKCYTKKNFIDAVHNYTKSTIFAEKNSEELALAYANRSAVHFTLKHYQSCLKDIENCENTGEYPHKLKHKLVLRQARCFQRLGQNEKCLQHINKLRELISTNNETFNEKKTKENILNEIEIIGKDIIDKDYIVENDTGREYKIPKVIDGPNDQFLYASSSVKLMYNEEKGRHVVASKPLEQGQVLFVEKPYALVPTYCDLEELTTRCYHCYKRSGTCVACDNCEVLFCNEACKNSSWSSYHKYECPGSCVNVWERLGISYLALRITLLGASYLGALPTVLTSDVSQFGLPNNDNYPYVWSMVTNFNKITDEFKLFNVTMALCLCEYLRMKTTFFTDMSEQLNISVNELQLRTGGVLLRHLLQVTSNASMVEDYHENLIDVLDGNTHLTDHTYVRAVGMYPTHSMLNHSCDSNIAIYFCDEVMIVKARRNIAEDEEICNSYGYSCYKQNTSERQKELLKQYCFSCTCSACTFPTKPEIFTESLLCEKCRGASLPLNNKTEFQCTSCHFKFHPKEHKLRLKDAEKLFKAGTKSGSLEILLKCLEFRQKSVPDNSEIIRETLQCLTEQCTLELEDWWKYTRKLLAVEREIIPSHSITYANNVKFTIETFVDLIENLQESKSYSSFIGDVPSELDNLRIELKRLYTLFYPPEIITIDKINNLFDKASKRIEHVMNSKNCK